jgi:hypothetical protein
LSSSEHLLVDISEKSQLFHPTKNPSQLKNLQMGQLQFIFYRVSGGISFLKRADFSNKILDQALLEYHHAFKSV